MNKKILSSILWGVLVLPSLALAQLEPCAPGGPCVTGGLRGLVHNIELVAGFLFGFIAVICFVIAGVLFLTAQGSPEKVQQARSAFMWGVVGVIVGIIAFSIIAIVSSFLVGSFVV